ncbi:MAG TPA: hypothetical protein VFT70_16135 [Nocardioides sp.]|nr:hypothetical protein [Nocardioides sp.]
MNARRKSRILTGHKPPLVAFVLLVVTSSVLLVHMARSEAAPAWLRQGVTSVVAGGAPLGQRVVDSTLVRREPAATVQQPPAAAAPAPVTAPAAPAAPVAPAPSAPAPAAPSEHHGAAHAQPQVAAPSAAPVEPASPPAPADGGGAPEQPGVSPHDPGHAISPGRGPRGDGVDVPGWWSEHGPLVPWQPQPTSHPGPPSHPAAPRDPEHPVRGDGPHWPGQPGWWIGPDRGHGHAHHGHRPR